MWQLDCSHFVQTLLLAIQSHLPVEKLSAPKVPTWAWAWRKGQCIWGEEAFAFPRLSLPLGPTDKVLLRGWWTFLQCLCPWDSSVWASLGIEVGQLQQFSSDVELYVNRDSYLGNSTTMTRTVNCETELCLCGSLLDCEPTARQSDCRGW